MKGGTDMIAAIRLFVVVLIIFSLSLMLACAGREFAPKDPYPYWYYPKELPEADRAVGQAARAGKDRECPDEFNAVKKMEEDSYETYVACRDKEAVEMANKTAAKAKGLCVFKDVHFEFNKSTLTEKAKEILQRNIRVLEKNPRMKVRIAGHACQHGSEHSNLELSKQRVNAVREYLVKGGIAQERLSTIAYGDTKPLFVLQPTRGNINSREMKENRRVHFEAIMK